MFQHSSRRTAEALPSILPDQHALAPATILLSESQDCLAEISRLSPDGFFINDGRATIAVNEAGMTLLRGSSRDQIIGREAIELFRADFHDAIREWMGILMRGPASVPVHEEVMIAVDGAEVPVEVRATSSIIDGKLRILVACRDLSERKAIERRLREERDFSDAALNGLPGIFYHFAEDGRFLRWNRNFERVTGYSAEELGGMAATDFFADDEKPLIASRIAEIYEKGETEVEAHLVLKDGRRIPYLYTAVYFEKDGQRGFIGVALDVSDSKAMEKKFREERDFSRAVLDSLPGIFYHYDEGQRLIRWNKNHEVVTGYSAGELSGMSPLDFFAAEDLALIASRIGDVMERGDSSVEANFIVKDGRTIPFLFTGVNLDHGGRRGFVGIGIDLTDRKQAEIALREKTALLEAQIESSVDGILIVDHQNRKLVQNRRLVELWKIPADLANNSDNAPQLDYLTAKTVNPAEFLAKVEWLSGHPNEISRDEVELVDGTFMDRYSAPVRDQDGYHYGRIWAFRDITETKQAQNRIRHLAHYDALTELPNRHTFQFRLNERLSNPDALLSLVYVDLDGFKLVNDTRGHTVGDELLQQVAGRLTDAAKGVDMFIARLGGDEFAGIAPQADAACAMALAQSLVATLSAPYHLSGDRQIVIGASVGVALAPEHGTDVETLLTRADIALYRAKAAGKGTARVFSPEMEGRIQEQMKIETGLRTAVQSSEGLFVFYQPIVDIEAGTVTAREALMRWHHPERGWVSPAEFIPVAEKSGLIDQLGEFVLRRACYDAAEWTDGARVAVNISANQLGKGTLASVVLSALADSGLRPDRLEIEVTETALLTDENDTIDDLQQVHRMGVRVALDDFGTGYSSLSHLRIFPFDKIKIDGSFVRDAIDQPYAAAVVRAVADLGHRLGVTTVAEGVETEAHLHRVREEGCTEVQGYVYGRPEPTQRDAEIIAGLRGVARSDAA